MLEHLPRPWDAAAEIARVLQPGGCLILSVPHLFAIHEAPNDFYRYTRYGLTSLLSGAGLQVVEVRETCGLACFLGHDCSAVLLCTLGCIPGCRRIAWGLNYALLIALLRPFDRWLGFQRLFPCNHIAVARKPALD